MAMLARALLTALCLIFVVASTGASPATQTPQPTPAPTLPTLTQSINDFAGVIDADSARALDERIRAVRAATGDVVVITTVPTIAPFTSVDEYALKLFEQAGIGNTSLKNGLLILVAVKEHGIRVEVGTGLDAIVSDGFARDTIQRLMIPEFRAERFGPGLVAGTNELTARMMLDRRSGATGPVTNPLVRFGRFDQTVAVLAIAFFAAAALYASVGHAGASGYLAAMALVGVPVAMMRPTALVLNVLVASIALIRFSRAGFFSWRLAWPFALGAIPFAFIGGAITLPGHWYRTLIGIILWLAASRLWLDLRRSAPHDPPVPVAIVCGGGIGFLAGITGTGGGIFLSPLLLFMGWADTRQTGGVAAAFILVNSLAGLAANPSSLVHLPTHWPVWALAAVAGGVIGAEVGSRRLNTSAFRKLLGVVLLIAGGKLIFS
jgi:uncharacterized membrane protein YfcA